MGSHWPLLKTYQHLHRVKTHEGGRNPGIFKVHKSWFSIGLGNFWIPASGDHSRQHLNINQSVKTQDRSILISKKTLLLVYLYSSALCEVSSRYQVYNMFLFLSLSISVSSPSHRCQSQRQSLINFKFCLGVCFLENPKCDNNCVCEYGWFTPILLKFLLNK